MVRKFKLNKLIIIICLASMIDASAIALMQNDLFYQYPIHKNRHGNTAKQYSIQNMTFVYDNRGNLLVRSINNQKTIFHYNAINQLVSIHNPDGSSITLKNNYDDLGNMRHDSVDNHYNAN